MFSLVWPSTTTFSRRDEPILTGIVRHILISDHTTRFERIAHEFETRNPTYCHDASCAPFIGRGSVRGSIGTCSRSGCGKHTCVLYKKEAHVGEYTQDETSEDVMSLA